MKKWRDLGVANTIMLRSNAKNNITFPHSLGSFIKREKQPLGTRLSEKKRPWERVKRVMKACFLVSIVTGVKSAERRAALKWWQGKK